MIVLNLLKQYWINLVKALEDVAELVMVCGHHLVISQGGPFVNDVIVLLQVEEIIISQVVVAFLLDLVLNHERHVAV